MKNARKAAESATMHRSLPPELFAGLLALSADAVIGVDEKQRIVFFNAGAERIFGWTAAEIVGRPLEDLLPVRYRATHHAHVRKFGEAHEEARLMGHRQEISGLRKSGEEFPAEASIQQFDVEGHHMYAAILRDVGERKRAEDALKLAIKARDDMIGIVSHDLRNPANAIRMLAQSIVTASAGLSSPVIDNVKVMQQAAEQMDRLIQDLLDVTRMEAGRLAVFPETVSIAALLEQEIEQLRPIADANGVTLHGDISGGVGNVRADPQRILQVISNVVGNSIKFTPSGGNVYLSAKKANDYVEIEVRDTGVGISPEQLPHVFERFFQVSNTARVHRHGAGLGLPIARGIIQAHGGRIWVESEVEQGTAVHFTIPAVRGSL